MLLLMVLRFNVLHKLDSLY